MSSQPQYEPRSRDLAEARECVLQLGRLYGLQTLLANDDEQILLEPAYPTGSATARLMVARAWIRANRLREKHLDGCLFADPAWDLLLDLYINRHLNRQVSITSACIAANVPPTTALRWVTLLTARGWLQRTKDVADRRRHFIQMPDHVAASMDALLDDVLDSDHKIGLERMRVVKPANR